MGRHRLDRLAQINTKARRFCEALYLFSPCCNVFAHPC